MLLIGLSRRESIEVMTSQLVPTAGWEMYVGTFLQRPVAQFPSILPNFSNVSFYAILLHFQCISRRKTNNRHRADIFSRDDFGIPLRRYG